MTAHDTPEQILYRTVSAARNLAHLDRHDEAAVVAWIGVEAYESARTEER